MSKNKTVISESQLHRIIMESMKSVLNESRKGVDSSNVVPERLARKYGFEPAYSGFDGGLELWEKKGVKDKDMLLRALHISKFTTWDIYGKVRITVRPDEKPDFNSDEPDFRSNGNGRIRIPQGWKQVGDYLVRTGFNKKPDGNY